MANAVFHNFAKKFPDLYRTLQQAEMKIDTAQFVQNCTIKALTSTILGGISIFFFLNAMRKPVWILFVLVPLFFLLSFATNIKTPDVVILKKRKEIDKEILFAGKFFIVEIKAGVPVYQALKNMSQDYDGTGIYFQRIVDDVDMGTSLEEAISTAIVTNPSEYFQKVMWQVMNSIQTGADITLSLSTVLDQISKKQLIEVERYGKKLNPLAMFYLMVSVIFPSLGMVMLVVLVSFANVKLPLLALFGIAIVITFLQYMFYSIIKSARPAVDL